MNCSVFESGKDYTARATTGNRREAKGGRSAQMVVSRDALAGIAAKDT
jgi:hypothetical protein